MIAIPVLVYKKWTEDSRPLIMKHLLPAQHIQRIGDHEMVNKGQQPPALPD
jgi:hypothetical protein